jgi:nucleoside-diphosphate-sugar epimerase
MHALVTGAAGFVGSHLVEHLASAGHRVRAVDSLTDYYDLELKRANRDAVAGAGLVESLHADLLTASIEPLLDGVDVVFHLAGQPGVRLSWSDGFDAYVDRNVRLTQRLLEASRTADLGRFVFSSSSSVYGNAASYPVSEGDLPQPHSPYGVTKLAAEHLCGLYAANWGLPTTALRYFTVYGPRQRPDMAITRLCHAAITGEPFPLFGDGSAVRDFTYVGDVVAATVAAGTAELDPGTVLNVAGGGQTSMTELIELVGDAFGAPVPVDRRPGAPGDVVRTGGDTSRARAALGWTPETDLVAGVAAQVAWSRGVLGASHP